MGLKQEDLAKEIAEKESVIHWLETGRHEPSLELARKLEKFLGIRLIDEAEEGTGGGIISAESKGKYTLGDFIKIKKRK